MVSKGVVTLILLISLIGSILVGANTVSAQPPAQESTTSLQIETAYPTVHKLGEDYYIHTHVYNTATEELVTSGVSCYYHFYNHQINGGEHASTGNLTLYGMGYSNTVDGSLINESGEYSTLIWCNSSTEIGFFRYTFDVTSTGDVVKLSDTIIVFAFAFIASMFLLLSIIFGNQYWMIKMFFQMMAIGTGILVVNSAKIIASSSDSLSAIGNVGLTIIIVMFSLFFLIAFIYAFIEIIKAFKEKRGVRWEY